MADGSGNGETTYMPGEDRAAAGAGDQLDPARTAVVVIDMINHQLSADHGFLPAMAQAGADTGYIVQRVGGVVLPNLQRLLGAARARGARVVYLRVGSASGDFDDINPHVRAMLASWDARDGAWPCDVVEALAPEPGDVSLVKSGSGGFTTSGLHEVLQGAGIDTVVYTGVVTDGCVLLTAGAGWDLGYRGLVVTDATATFVESSQRAAEQLMSTFMATLVTTDEACRLLGAPAGPLPDPA